MRASVHNPRDLGRVIRRVREQHSLTQRELADRLSVSQRYLSELENGRPKIADERYFDLLRLLGLTMTVQTSDE
ncbi:MAG: helix-turn-helix transcriptional regulator [Rhodoglobus sp.]